MSGQGAPLGAPSLQPGLQAGQGLEESWLGMRSFGMTPSASMPDPAWQSKCKALWDFGVILGRLSLDALNFLPANCVFWPFFPPAKNGLLL